MAIEATVKLKLWSSRATRTQHELLYADNSSDIPNILVSPRIQRPIPLWTESQLLNKGTGERKPSH
eukprot:467868-Amphidinium_carterae.1